MSKSITTITASMLSISLGGLRRKLSPGLKMHCAAWIGSDFNTENVQKELAQHAAARETPAST